MPSQPDEGLFLGLMQIASGNDTAAALCFDRFADYVRELRSDDYTKTDVKIGSSLDNAEGPDRTQAGSGLFNLRDIINNAQDGNAITNLARQFGITNEQAQTAVQILIPAVSSGLLQKTGNPNTLNGVISAIADPDYGKAFADSDAATSDLVKQKSSDVVSNIFGSNQVVYQISQEASFDTGLQPDVLMRMLPVVVAIVLGGIGKSAQAQGFGGMLAQIAATSQQHHLGRGSLANLLNVFRSGHTAETTQHSLDSLSRALQSGHLPVERVRQVESSIEKILKNY